MGEIKVFDYSVSGQLVVVPAVIIVVGVCASCNWPMLVGTASPVVHPELRKMPVATSAWVAYK